MKHRYIPFAPQLFKLAAERTLGIRARLSSSWVTARLDPAGRVRKRNDPVLVVIGNDYGYDYVFARQVESMGRAGDVVFAISTSGNSKNILRAIEAAKVRDMRVVGFSGLSGGAMGPHCDVCFKVPSSETPRIQEGHEFLGHLICGLIEQELFGQGP